MGKFNFRSKGGGDGRRVSTDNGQRAEPRPVRVLGHGERGDSDKVIVHGGVRVRTIPKHRLDK